MIAYQDPNHPGNSPVHHTGKSCIEEGCDKPAGTAWSPLWCPACNVVRMDRIDRNLRGLVRRGNALDALTALIRKSKGSVRVHHPVTAPYPQQDD